MYIWQKLASSFCLFGVWTGALLSILCELRFALTQRLVRRSSAFRRGGGWRLELQRIALARRRWPVSYVASGQAGSGVERSAGLR